MADVDIASFGFDVNTAGLRAGSDELSRFEARIDAATSALARLEARSATALSGISPAMRAALGPSPVGGSAAGAFGGAAGMGSPGPTASQLAALTASTTSLTAALHGTVAPLGSLVASAQAAAAALRAIGQAAPPRLPAPAFTPPTSIPAPAAPSSPAPRPGGAGGGAGGHGSGGTGHGGAASYGNQLQMMELAHISRALFDEAAAGGNVLRGLMMEAGRLQIAFSAGEGGLTGLLGRVGGAASRLASPLALASAGLVGLGAAAAIGFGRFTAEQDALEVALRGRGRFSGLTLDGANRLAASGAAAGGLSLSEGSALTTAALGAGLTGDATRSVVEMSRDFGRFTGKGTDEAGKMLTAALADPVRGLSEMDKLLGGVDDRLRVQIDDAVRSGHLMQAQALELGFVNRAMHEAGEAGFSFSRAMSGAGNWISDRITALGHGVASAFGYGGDADNLAKNKAMLAELQRSPDANAGDIVALRQEIGRLEAAIGKSNLDAARREAEGRAIELSGRAGDAIRQLLPEVARQRTAAGTVELLRSVLSDPLVMGHMDPGISGAMVGRAFSQASVLEAMSRPGLRERQDYDLGLSRIRDSGVQDQGLNEARRAELAVLRETGDVMKAVTAAQRGYNLELAKAQESADALARQAHNEFGLVGLSPYDRAKKQLEQEYLGPRGLIEHYSVEKGGNNVLADKDISGDLHGGFKILAAAQETAGGITTAGGHLVSAVEGIAARVEAAGGRIGPAEAAARGTAPWAGALDRGAFGGGSAIAPQFTAGGAFGHAPADIQLQVLAASMRTGMPAGIIAALGERENGFRLTGGTNIKGPDGRPASSAYGFGQLTDGAAADVARAMPGFNKFDPNTAVLGAAEYLKILTGRFGDMETALNHYGTGPGYGADILRRAGGASPVVSGGTMALPVIDVRAAPIHVAVRDAGTAPLGYSGDASARSAYADKSAALEKSYASPDPLQRGTALGEATLKLREQSAALEVQAAMFGRSDAAIKGAAAAQGLWSPYLDSGVARTSKLSDATGELANQIRLYGSEVEKVAQQQDDFDRMRKGMIEASDFARGSLSSVLTSGVTAAAHGRSFWEAAKGSLAQIGDQLIGKGVSGAISGLLGAPGSMLGTGGVGGAGGGGFLSNIFGSFFGGAHADGGPIVGPGSGTSDSILARVSNGEYIMRASATQHYGSNLLDRINNLSFPKFAYGGLVGAPTGTADEAGVSAEGDF